MIEIAGHSRSHCRIPRYPTSTASSTSPTTSTTYFWSHLCGCRGSYQWILETLLLWLHEVQLLLGNHLQSQLVPLLLLLRLHVLKRLWDWCQWLKLWLLVWRRRRLLNILRLRLQALLFIECSETVRLMREPHHSFKWELHVGVPHTLMQSNHHTVNEYPHKILIDSAALDCSSKNFCSQWSQELLLTVIFHYQLENTRTYT